MEGRSSLNFFKQPAQGATGKNPWMIFPDFLAKWAGEGSGIWKEKGRGIVFSIQEAQIAERRPREQDIPAIRSSLSHGYGLNQSPPPICGPTFGENENLILNVQKLNGYIAMMCRIN